MSKAKQEVQNEWNRRDRIANTIWVVVIVFKLLLAASL